MKKPRKHPALAEEGPSKAKSVRKTAELVLLSACRHEQPVKETAALTFSRDAAACQTEGVVAKVTTELIFQLRN